MVKKSWILALGFVAILLASIVGYQALLFESPIDDNVDDQDPTVNPTSSATPTQTPTKAPTASPTATIPSNGGSLATSTPTPQPTPSPTTTSTVAHEPDHEDPADYVWNSNEVINIALNGNSIVTNSATAIVEGSKITLTSAGTYRISGTLTDGQVIVNTQEKATTRLILSNAQITCSSSAPIYVLDATKTIIVLEEGTTNTIIDTNPDGTTEPNAAVFSKSDLTIYGLGQLNVAGNSNDGIASKDGLIIKSGTIVATSLDDGVRGKDYLIVKDGVINVTAGANGLISTNSDNATRGYLNIEKGEITITSSADAIQAQTDVTITNGLITITSGGGSNSFSTQSTKGIKGTNSVNITSGTFSINSADDAIHSNNTLIVSSGAFTISTGDDAIHSDKDLIIDGGTIDILKCYEGIESANLTINGGTIHIISSDDGLNGAGGNDGSGFQPGPGAPPGPGAFALGNYSLVVNGGYIVITASGDGIDVNGAITMTGGTIIINGPTANNNGAIDYDTTFKMTGGFILGVGSVGMAQMPSPISTQCAILLNLRVTRPAGTLIHIETASGADILTYRTIKVFQSIALCAPTLTQGTTYNLYLGGSSTGTLKDGLYQGGTYTGGTLIKTFPISGINTKLVNL